MPTILLICLSFYLICGVLAYGLSLGYFQREFPDLAKQFAMEDVCFAFILGFLCGPIGLTVALWHNRDETGRWLGHGFLFWPKQS